MSTVTTITTSIATHINFGDLALPYGVGENGMMISVTDAMRGKSCNCTCPECNRKLVAKQGQKNRWHFAHEADSACAGALETMIHRLGKQIIAEEKWILLPRVEVSLDSVTRAVRPATRVTFESVDLEVWKGGYRPDILGRVLGKELAIEIAVTHLCDDDKIALLQSRGAATVEIDLSHYRKGFDPIAFRKAVLEDAPRWWLVNSLADQALRELEEERRVKLEEQAYRRLLEALRVDIGRQVKPSDEWSVTTCLIRSQDAYRKAISFMENEAEAAQKVWHAQQEINRKHKESKDFHDQVFCFIAGLRDDSPFHDPAFADVVVAGKFVGGAQ